MFTFAQAFIIHTIYEQLNFNCSNKNGLFLYRLFETKLKPG